MTVGQDTQNNVTNKQNPLIDTGQVTVNAFNALQNKQKTDKNFILGRDDNKVSTSPNNKVKVKVWTNQDDKTHTYFHSLSIDKQVTDFMGTAELRCPYDSDLMEYWEPIRQSCVIYGANRGDYKILFIGRVRELKQDGYELVVSLQDYGWKFKQDVSQSYANDNVLNKNGYAIICAMFEALKIDSYVISESAKNRLKQVGINEDGNLTMNGEELKEMPDLIERLKDSDPSKLLSKTNLNDKLKEKYVHNIENINYTLKYEEPTPVMKEIQSNAGGYSSGSTVYANPYSSASAVGGGGGGGSSKKAVSGSTSYTQSQCNAVLNRSTPCAIVKNATIGKALVRVQAFNVGCVNDYPYDQILNYAKSASSSNRSNVLSCLNTMAKNVRRKDKRNGAQELANAIRSNTGVAGVIKSVQNRINTGLNNLAQQSRSALNWAATEFKKWIGWK